MSCPACGHTAPAGSKFCNECGAKLAAAVEPQPSERTPRDYTPRHLADKILTTRAALEGERKQVTVLFADVKGSMDLAEGLDPEAWHAILDRFFQILADGVHRFEGTVNQYTGDGIMALFGAPLAHEDHAQRACYAALHLRDALRSYTAELKRSRDIHFAARMGLASGEVVVGKIGDDLRMDYTAQGHTAGIAQRMEQLADPGSIYMAEGTARLVEGYFELGDLGEFKMKGASGPVCAWELTGADRHRTRFEVSLARGLSLSELRRLEEDRSTDGGLILESDEDSDGFVPRSLLEANDVSESWAGFDKGLGQEVALRLFRVEGEAADSILDDAATAMRITHPNLVKVHSARLVRGYPCVVSESVGGTSLATVLDSEGALAAARLLQIAEGMLEALSELHAMNPARAHGRLSAGRVLLDEFDTARIADLVLPPLGPPPAPWAQGDGEFTYLAPEQCLGSAASPQSDLYSFGCILYAMATGSAPFTGSASRVTFGHNVKEPRAPSEIRPDLEPRGLSDLILECLAKRPEARPQSAIHAQKQLNDAFAAGFGEPGQGNPGRGLFGRRKRGN